VKRIRAWSGPVATLVVLLVLIWRLGTGPFVGGLEAVDGRAVLAAVAIGFVTTVCGAWRWTVVARGLGLRLALPTAVAAYYRALFLNLTLPTGIAGDVHRGVSHGRGAHDVGRGLRAVVWERGAGQVVQVALTVVVLLILPSPVHSSMPFVAAAALGVAVGAVAASRKRRPRWLQEALPTIALTTTVAVVGYAVLFLVAARTVGVTAPISRLLPLAMLAVLAMVLPSIAGWGPREGATAWVFSAAGLGAAAGAATAVAYGVLALAAFLPGALVLVAGRLPRARLPEGATDG
jgi:glycosyltransferase 2 family protein